MVRAVCGSGIPYKSQQTFNLLNQIIFSPAVSTLNESQKPRDVCSLQSLEAVKGPLISKSNDQRLEEDSKALNFKIKCPTKRFLQVAFVVKTLIYRPRIRIGCTASTSRGKFEFRQDWNAITRTRGKI